MKAIDEARLETDLEYRFQYLCEFLNFGAEDSSLIQQAAPYLGPAIPLIVEKTYEKLLAFDATARHFIPRQSGFDGPTPPDLASLNANHPQIRFRREHLARYFQQILGRSFDARMILYLDMVGKIHTPRAGNAEIDVPLVQMNALMGLLSDILIDFIGQIGLDLATAFKTVRAFEKLLWIQNDFITRHYSASLAAALAASDAKGGPAAEPPG